MEFIVWILHLLVAGTVVGLVLLQHGKGADMGAAFGSGSSGSLFGASGSANFLSRTTAVLATAFFMTSLGLTYFSTQKHVAVQAVVQPAQPAAPVTAPQAAPQPAGEADKSGAIPK
jgi:preprotein translocase subunit SecG